MPRSPHRRGPGEPLLRLLLGLWVVLAPPSHLKFAAACPLEIWTFDSLELCLQASQNLGALAPVSRGTILADGTCRTTSLLTSTASPHPLAQLPGNYTASCRDSTEGVADHSNGSVLFTQSGCVEDTCAPTVPGGNTCQKDWSTPSALYAALGVPILVQDASLRTTGFFECAQINGGSSATGGSVQVAYAVFGDCRCTHAPTVAPSPQPTTSVAPTGMPVADTTTTTTTTTTVPPPPSSSVESTPQATDATTTTTTTTTTSTPESPTTSGTTESTPSQSTPSLRPTSAPTPVGSPNNNFVPGDDSGNDDGGTDSDNKSTLPLIAGGAAGGFVAVALAAVVLWFLFAQKSNISRKGTSGENDSILPEGESPTTHSHRSSSAAPTGANPAASTSVAAALFGEVWCSPADDVSTLGEPVGLESNPNNDRFDESTVSTPSTYMHNLLSSDNQSRMSTATDPDALLDALGSLPDQGEEHDDQASFDQIFGSPVVGRGKNVHKFQVNIPPGRLGIMLDDPDDDSRVGPPVVHTIRADSIFASHDVRVGDALVAVDDVQVRRMSAARVSQLIVSKARQPRRLFWFERVVSSSPRATIGNGEDEQSEQEV